FKAYSHPTALHSFPTRRSSDLGDCVTLSNQSTANATASGVTPTGACSSTSGTADDDVWFSFVAPASTVIMTGTNVSGATDVFWQDRKSTRLNSSHVKISYAVFC